jgi:hypothetical protein
VHPTKPFIDATDARQDPGRLRHLAATHGHLLLRHTLPEEVVRPVRQSVLQAAHTQGLISDLEDPRLDLETMQAWQGYADPRWVALQQAVLATEEARMLPEHPTLVDLLEALYQGPVMTHRGDICRLGVPDRHAPTHTTPPHQDHYYLGGSTDLWTAWTPLIDCPIELGPLAVWSGSHLGGYKAHAGEGEGQQHVDLVSDLPWSSEALKVGDVVLFHCMTVHRALPNSTDDLLRLSMDMRYQPADQPIDTCRLDGTRP